MLCQVAWSLLRPPNGICFNLPLVLPITRENYTTGIRLWAKPYGYEHQEKWNESLKRNIKRTHHHISSERKKVWANVIKSVFEVGGWCNAVWDMAWKPFVYTKNLGLFLIYFMIMFPSYFSSHAFLPTNIIFIYFSFLNCNYIQPSNII